MPDERIEGLAELGKRMADYLKTKKGDQASLTHPCPAGQIYDPKIGKCIPIVRGGKLA